MKNSHHHYNVSCHAIVCVSHWTLIFLWHIDPVSENIIHCWIKEERTPTLLYYKQFIVNYELTKCLFLILQAYYMQTLYIYWFKRIMFQFVGRTSQLAKVLLNNVPHL